MTNLKDNKTKVTGGYYRNITGIKGGDWHVWQKRDQKIHHMILTNMDVIPGLHVNLFSVTQALQKGFKLTSEGETLILNKNQQKNGFDKQMGSKSGEEFLLTTNVYKNANKTALREGSQPTVKVGRQETRKYDNQTNRDT